MRDRGNRGEDTYKIGKPPLVKSLRQITGKIQDTQHGVSRARYSCTRYFFQRDTSSEAVSIVISEDNPLVKSIDCSTPLHSTRILNQFIRILCERPTPLYPLLYGSLFSIY